MPVCAASLRLVCTCVLLFILSIPSTGAITDEEYFRNFRFNFGNPGARALAMGGAFIAIADDATAAQANPARIAFLRRPEFFAEVRRRDVPETSTPDDRFFIDPNLNPAASFKLDSTVTPEDQTGLSNLAVVWPFSPGPRHLSVGLSRQELLTVESTTTGESEFVPTNSSLFQDPNAPTEIVRTEGDGDIDASIVLWNLSAGLEMTRHLFIGASVTVGQLEVTGGQETRYSDPFLLQGLGGIDPRYQNPSSTPVKLFDTSIDGETDTDVKWSFGIFYEMNRYLSFGASYRKGVRFEIDEALDADPNSTISDATFQTTFNVPDISGVGVSYRPFAGSPGTARSRLLIALDLVRIEYADLAEDFVSGVSVLTRETGRATFTADNQTEVHFGIEYLIPHAAGFLAFRGGFYTDPDSNLRLEEAEGGAGGLSQALQKGEAFPARDDEEHVTFGMGLSLGDFEFAAGYDDSDIETQALFSVIYRMKPRP